MSLGYGENIQNCTIFFCIKLMTNMFSIIMTRLSRVLRLESDVGRVYGVESVFSTFPSSTRTLFTMHKVKTFPCRKSSLFLYLDLQSNFHVSTNSSK